MTTQAQVITNNLVAPDNEGVGPQPQTNASTIASKIRDLRRMNPPTFRGTMVN